MAQDTGIQFADSTANGMMGCDGCELWTTRPDGSRVRICYAGVLTERMLLKGPHKGYPPSFDVPTLFPGRIEATRRWKDLTGTKREDKPWLDGMPRIIFCDDMGDRWTASLPIDSLAPTLPAIAASPHIYLFLTKRPDRAAAFSREHLLPPNLWLGCTITSGQDARLRALERARASVLWVSYEPILADAGDVVRRHPAIRWWVFGGSSGAESVPTDLAVIRGGVAACRETKAAPFVKQLGTRPRGWCDWKHHQESPATWLDDDGVLPEVSGNPATDLCHSTLDGHGPCAPKLRDRKGGDWSEWTGALEDIRVREFPA